MGYGFERVPIIQARTRFDLNKHQIAATGNNDVYLTSRTPPITLDNSVTRALQKRDRYVFAAATQSPAGRISTWLTHAGNSARRFLPADSNHH